MPLKLLEALCAAAATWEVNGMLGASSPSASLTHVVYVYLLETQLLPQPCLRARISVAFCQRELLGHLEPPRLCIFEISTQEGANPSARCHFCPKWVSGWVSRWLFTFSICTHPPHPTVLGTG